MNPPVQVPIMAGPPAITARDKNVFHVGRSFNNGAAIPTPSVILWSVKQW